MAKKSDYKADLLENLRSDPDYAAEYLSAAYDDSQEAFLVALRDVAEAKKGLAKIAKQTKLNRENLYRTLSEHGNPRLNTVGAVLDVLNFKVLIVSKLSETVSALLSCSEPIAQTMSAAMANQSAQGAAVSTTPETWTYTFASTKVVDPDNRIDLQHQPQVAEDDIAQLYGMGTLAWHEQMASGGRD